MRGMQEDFADVIAERNLGNAWRLTLKSLKAGGDASALGGDERPARQPGQFSHPAIC